MTWMSATRANSEMIYLKGRVWAVSSNTMDIFDYNTSTWTRQWIPFPTNYDCLTKLSPNQFILIGGDQNNRVSKNVMMKIFQKNVCSSFK